jgi:hypothetical protein
VLVAPDAGRRRNLGASATDNGFTTIEGLFPGTGSVAASGMLMAAVSSPANA